MKNFFAYISRIFNRDEHLRYSVPKFANRNKNLLIIVADPKTDRIFVTYRGAMANGRIKSTTGKNLHVVKEVLKESRFSAHADNFIVSIMETLNVSLLKGNQFYQFLDGAIYGIGKHLAKLKKARRAAPGPMPGAVPSPFQGVGSGEPKDIIK